MLKIKEKIFTVVNYKIISLFLCLLCVFAAAPETAKAQTTEFTYQDKLTDGGMSGLGLGAEDVAAIEPVLVTYNTAGEVKGVKYDHLGVVLLNAVKEQQAKIETQQNQIQKQNSQIEQ